MSRLVGRLVAEFHLWCARDAIAALRDISGRRARLDHAVVMLIVLRLSDAGQTTLRSGSGTAPPRGGISINAIATSLRRPFETVRRHVNLMLNRGVLMHSAHGVAVADGVRGDVAMHRLRQQMHDNLVLLIETLADFAVALPASRAGAVYDQDATISASIDFFLSSIEFLGPHYSSWLDLLVVNLVMAASVRHLTFDSILARRFAAADTTPPARFRHFVNIVPLAESFGMSGSTMRRHLADAIATGKLEGRPQRARARDDFLRGEIVNAGGTAQAARATQTLNRLAVAGFDFAAPGRHYIAGRPALFAAPLSDAEAE
jgi:hypothetical protein